MGALRNVDQTVVDEILAGPYFAHDIPKTTGRETFGDSMDEDICDRMIGKGATPEDCVATITRITAKALADAYDRWGQRAAYRRFILVVEALITPTSSHTCNKECRVPGLLSWMR